MGCVRLNNEDACAVSATLDTLSDWQGDLLPEGGWALIADGLGGHAAGEVASTLAMAVMRPLMDALSTDEDVAAIIQAADAALYMAMEQAPELRGMGTTIAGAVMRRGQASIFNIGDSRVYAYSDGRLIQLSVDDSVGHRLTQCLGGAQAPIRLTPHLKRLAISPGDRLLLCSDGLTDMVANADITQIFLSRPSNPAAALVDAALTAGGDDNVSVIVIEAVG